MFGRSRFTEVDYAFIGIVLKGFFYGLYSAIFTMHMQCQASKNSVDKMKKILFYLLCTLYTLSTAILVIDIITFNLQHFEKGTQAQILRFLFVSATIHGLCDFISQAILIYRCWITWNCNTPLMIIPSVLALACLATWMAFNGSFHNVSPDFDGADWGDLLVSTSLAISLIVNAVVTGLIVLRILKVCWVREGRTFALGVGGSNLRSIVFIIIESGMTMFAAQLIWLVTNILALNATYFIIGISQMLNGITPTIILVRASMGLSFHDEESMVETVASLHFASNLKLETGSADIADEERRDDIGVQQSDNIEIQAVDR